MGTLAGNLATTGAREVQMENQLSMLSITVENLTAAEASIRNTDVAAEMANLTRLQILQQASATVLAQANQAPSLALQLLGG